MRIVFIIALTCYALLGFSQDHMTPETLWKLGRVSSIGLTKDNRSVVYRVSTPNVAENKSSSKTYILPLQGGNPKEVTDAESLVRNSRISPDGRYKISAGEVKINKVDGKDFYPTLDKSTVQIYDQLNYRHWDEWEDGAYSHIFIHQMTDGKAGAGKDIMEGLPYDAPQKPFGGDEDYLFSPDSKSILYVTKAKTGADYAQSTNTDIYQYDIATGKTTNLTDGMEGYDTAPAFSSKGTLAWLSMKRDGYEADKNDLIIKRGNERVNLTANWDGTVSGFEWSTDGTSLYFNAPVQGTLQLLVVNVPSGSKAKPVIKQLTSGQFDINGIVGQAGNTLVV
ncbi:MAG TPA: hypothetical protein VLZ28_03900, partial [Daejeonella sp.]|nr:hypothetical protein [Daejeonella sp.]